MKHVCGFVAWGNFLSRTRRFTGCLSEGIGGIWSWVEQFLALYNNRIVRSSVGSPNTHMVFGDVKGTLEKLFSEGWIPPDVEKALRLRRWSFSNLGRCVLLLFASVQVYGRFVPCRHGWREANSSVTQRARANAFHPRPDLVLKGPCLHATRSPANQGGYLDRTTWTHISSLRSFRPRRRNPFMIMDWWCAFGSERTDVGEW